MNPFKTFPLTRKPPHPWPNLICIFLFCIFSLPYNVQSFASFWLSAWKFNGVVNIYAVGWMPLNAVVNNCWNWTIPVNCAQYGSTSLKNFNAHVKFWEIQFWVFDKYSLQNQSNGVEWRCQQLLELEHSCQLRTIWFRLIYIGYIWMRKTWRRT